MRDSQFAAEIRRDELDRREDDLRSWRDIDILIARDWAFMARSLGVDTRADVARCLLFARLWNHELIKLRRRRKLQ